MNKLFSGLLLALALLPSLVEAATPVRSFGVLKQRSALLTAEYWNPILDYVSRKSGVALEMRLGKTTPETSLMIEHGEFDFAYSNTIFTPANSPQGYRVIARPMEAAIQGQLVTAADSSIRTLSDLAGREVGFPSLAAFVGYAVPMNALLRQGIKVTPVFAGHQEGIMGQLKAGSVIAAGVNSAVMRDYAAREGFKYRVLWASEDYLNLPISAHPRIPEAEVRAVQTALLGMAHDPEGLAILERSAAVIKQRPPYGFVTASDADYRNYHEFYRHSLVKDAQ